jgi:hypothetical protein
VQAAVQKLQIDTVFLVDHDDNSDDADLNNMVEAMTEQGNLNTKVKRVYSEKMPCCNQ